jgi:hypothetical protein
MSNILILTSFTDNIRWNNYGKCDYGDFSSKNHLNYANNHGYSYLKEIVSDQEWKDYHPTWIKIGVILKYLKLFDYVVWIDSDAVFVDMSIKIEDLIEDYIDLVIPKMEVDKKAGKVWSSITTGFMIFKNSNWSYTTLKDMLENPGECRFGYFHEQTKLDEILCGHFTHPKASNLLNKEVIDLKNPLEIENIKILPYSYHRCWEDGTHKYIYHAGGDTPTKLQRVKRVLNSYRN